MFAIYCHIHESRVLLDSSRIEGMRQSTEGPVLDWRCWCGARGSLVAGNRSVPRHIEPVLVEARTAELRAGEGRSAAGRPWLQPTG